MTDDGPIIGVFLETQSGGRVNVRVVGADEVPLQSEIANAHMRLLVDEAVKAGVRPPAWFIFGSAQIFYKRGRPVEARMSGVTRKVAHYTDDGQPVWLFPPWSTDPAPRWSEDGGMMPEDAERTYQAARNQAVERDGELQPVLRRWWNLHEHSPRSFVFWRDLADLAESEADFPLAAQGVARVTLEKLRDEPAAAYALSEAGAPWQHKLVKGIKARLVELRQAAGMDGEAPPMDDAGAEVTRKASAWLAETFPKDGAESAEELRRRAMPEPWAPWWPEDGQNFAFVLRVLALLVWRNEVEAEAERARRTRPALPRVTAVDVSDVATRNAFLPGLDDGLVRSSKGGVRATISGGVVDVERVREGLALMPSMPFHRMVRTLVHAGYDQAEAGVEDYRVVSVPGGYAGLTERLELSAKYRKDVRLIAEAGARIEWRIGGRQGIAWWTLDAPVPGVTFAHRGQGAEVTFTLGTMLLPYAARRMRQQQTLADDAIDRRLVPELRYDPPMYGRGNEQAAIYTMARRFLTFMVDNGLELARDGGIVVTPEQWAKLAKASGLPAVLALKVVKKWADGDGDAAPPLIEYLDGGLVRLSETYRAEHDFIVDGVRRRAKRDQDIKRAHQRRKQES